MLEGLPSPAIHKLYQQSNGFLWIGSDSGISRYDGNQFKHYRFAPGHPRHISNNMITGIIEDAAGNIWVSTEDGLNRIAPEGNVSQFRHDPADPNTPSSAWLTGLFKDRNEQIWLIGERSLSRLEDQQGNLRHYFFPAADNGDPLAVGLSSFAQGRDGSIYLSSNIGLLMLPDADSDLQRVKLADPNAQSLLEQKLDLIANHPSGDLLIAGPSQGILRFNPQQRRITPFIAPESTTAEHKEKLEKIGLFSQVIQLDSGELWFGHYRGITGTTLDGQILGNLSHNDQDPFSLPSTYVYSMLQDDAGVIWVGTARGLAYYSPNRLASTLFAKGRKVNRLMDKLVPSVIEGQQGRIWSASASGLNRLTLPRGTASKHGGHARVESFPLLEAQDEINFWHLADDGAGNIWTAGGHGLHRFEKQTGTVQHYVNDRDNPYQLPPGEYYTVLPDPRGGVWFTGYTETGLSHFNPATGEYRRHLTEPDGVYAIGGNFTYQKIFGSDGAIWMATSDGILRVDPDSGRYRHYPVSEELAHIRVTGIQQHPNGDIWATTLGKGVVRLTGADPDTMKVVAVSQPMGMQETNFSALAFDSDDPQRLWVISRDLLYWLDLATQQVDAFPSLIEKRNFAFFHSALSETRNFLFIGSDNGLFQISKAELSQNQYQPKVVITDLLANGESVTELISASENSIGLPHEQNTLRIDFAAMDFTAPHQNHYRYRLSGVDADWVETSELRSVHYGNLKPGRYHFEVQGSNSDGLWSQHQAKLEITIHRPWWFWVLLALSGCILLLAIFFLYSRTQRVRQLSDLAYTDSLTQLANRRSLIVHLDQQLAKTPGEFALLFIDLDDFKQINDTHGHEIGDSYIRTISESLRQHVRDSDLLARLGGDEFAVLATGDLTQGKLEQIVTRLLEQLSSAQLLKGKLIRSSASIGVACFPGDGDTVSALMKNADTAMYAAKRKGKNTYCFFGEASSQALKHHFTLGSQIHQAIAQGQVIPFFQAKVCCDSGQIVGAEALARWQHPSMGLIPPVDFIQVAEANGAILDVGQAILRQACRQAKLWREQGCFVGTMAVNVSPIELKHAGYVQAVRQILAETGLPAACLELEITESLLVEDIHLAESLLAELKQLGVKVALDDFGTGYSSLSYLGDLSLDTLKIDRSFINEITGSSKKRTVLTGILQMAEALQLKVVAEGVETPQQLTFLKKQHCHQAQGYLFSKPVDAEQFASLLQREQRQPAAVD